MSNTLFGQDVIKSIGFDEGEILKNIMELYCPNGFDVDPCYSIGNFYKRYGIKKPEYKFDIDPKKKDVMQATAENLPFLNNAVKSIIFDPPFLSSSGESHNEEKDGINIIANRFSVFKSMKELWEWYSKCLIEFKRILKDEGILVFKCQDTVSSAKQYLSHVYIINEAEKLGFYTKDLFILLAKNRIIGGNHQVQQHARKFHSYFIVFIKKSLTNKPVVD